MSPGAGYVIRRERARVAEWLEAWAEFYAATGKIGAAVALRGRAREIAAAEHFPEARARERAKDRPRGRPRRVRP